MQNIFRGWWAAAIWPGAILFVHVLVTPGHFSDWLQLVPRFKGLFGGLQFLLNKPYIF